VAAGGTVGIIIPPSVMFILYGVTVGVSVSDLFLGGILPGIVMVAAMVGAGYVTCRMKNFDERTPFAMMALVRSAWSTKYAILAVVIMLGGIYLGIFTPTEAGAVACAYCVVVGLFVTRRLRVRKLPALMSRSGRICGLVAPIIALAVVFSQNLAALRVPQWLIELLLGISSDPFTLTLLIVLMLLVVGCVMETAPNILLLAPILAPFAVGLGFHPVHFGVLMTCVLAIGFITPPIGLNLFVASSISNASVLDVSRAVVPYLVALILAMMLIAFVPALSLAFIDTSAGIRLW
jgi:C4-dicarboxylate transporter DctM subunit